MMGDLTKNLSRSELICDCGCEHTAADFELVTLIQGAADHFIGKYSALRAVITITGGNRCEIRNEQEGGAKSSKHLFSLAADHRIEIITSDGGRRVIDTDELAGHYERKLDGRGGIGRYPNGRVHLDVSTGVSRPARWDKR